MQRRASSWKGAGKASVGQAARQAVQLPQRGLLLDVRPLAHHDEEVAVAVQVTRAEREGALDVRADERPAERRLGARDEVVQHAVELGVARRVGVEHARSVRSRAPPPPLD